MNGPHILVTTDFSDEAARALEPAARLTRAQGGRLTIIHVVPDLRAIPYGAPFAPAISDPDLPPETEKAKEAMAELRSSAVKKNVLLDDQDVHMEVLVAERVGHAICAYAKEHDVDYIAMSSHGYGNLRRLLVGSVTQSVLSEAEVPVIVYPKK